MNNELIGLGVKCSRSFKSSYVRAMAKFGLAVVTQNFVPLNQVDPVSALVVVGLVQHQKGKHRHVHANRHEPLEVVEPSMVRELN